MIRKLGVAGTSISVLDPSQLTTEQLRRELTMLREMVEIRLDAMDKAAELFHDNLVRVPTDTDKQISHLKELHDEKFVGVEKQFLERDVRSRAAEVAAQVAVNAALQAQKEAAAAQNDANAAAITKSEAATVKQIDGIQALIVSNTKASDDKVTVLNDRLTRSEGASKGVSASLTLMIAVVSVVAVVITLGMAILRNSTQLSTIEYRPVETAGQR
jgi:hypothetical protein